jgi:hypothetical protein
MEISNIQIDAAQLLYDDKMTDKAVAELVGVDVRTLRRWRELPEFKAELAARIRQHAVVTKEGRISSKLERYRLLNQLISDRAQIADQNIPGAATGCSSNVIAGRTARQSTMSSMLRFAENSPASKPKYRAN